MGLNLVRIYSLILHICSRSYLSLEKKVSSKSFRENINKLVQDNNNNKIMRFKRYLLTLFFSD